MGRDAPNKMEKGSKAYREMVQKGSKAADMKNLPFSFGKPQRAVPRPVSVWCDTCDSSYRVAKHTVCIECVVCKKLITVSDENSTR